MKSYLSLIFLLTIFCFVIPLKSYANVSCQPIYGGGQTCVTTSNVIVDKKVLNPQTNRFVNNLSINDPKYHPDFIVTFQISVTNSGNNTISNILVKDIFPQYITFSFGPGTFDVNTRTLSFTIQDLKVQETKTFTILGRVVSADKLTINQGAVLCMVNLANATSDNNYSQDNSQFCIEKIVVPIPSPTTKGGFPILAPNAIYTTPATGPESLVLFSLIPTALTGWFLRKKSRVF